MNGSIQFDIFRKMVKSVAKELEAICCIDIVSIKKILLSRNKIESSITHTINRVKTFAS